MPGTDQETQPDVTLTAEGTETPQESMFTQAQLDEARRQAKYAALADTGRLQKEAETAMKRAQGAQERIKRILKEQEESELKAAEGDQEQLSAIKERQKRRQVESDLEDAMQKLAEKDGILGQLETERQEAVRTQTSRDIASRLTVDPDRLIRLSKYTDGSAEAIEDIAKELPKLTPKPGLKPDSSRTLGGSQTEQQIRENYRNNPNDPQIRADYLAWRRSKGI